MEQGMAIGPPGRRNEPLHVVAMALMLIAAAFLGAGLGLAWHALASG
jgi:hypothetical protein